MIEPHSRRHFSLIELLTVLVIMGLMIGAGLPGLAKIARGSGVDGAERLISSQLKHAKSYALNKRRYVGLIFGDDRSLGTDSLYNYRSVRLAELTVNNAYNAANKFEFLRWMDGFKWEELPTGVICRMEAHQVTVYPPSKSDRQEKFRQGFDSITSSGAPKDMYALVITPSGKPQMTEAGKGEDGNGVKVEIAEGEWDPTLKKLLTASGSKDKNTNTVFVYVDQPTGRISTKYVTGAEK